MSPAGAIEATHIPTAKLPLSKTGGNLADDQDGTQTEW
jgi:hypothetical protein